MKTVLKIGGVLLAILLLVGAGVLFRQRQARNAEADAVPQTATVTRGSIEETVSASGNVVADREATLAFESSGPIAEVLVEKGQAVQSGQVLARLDTASLDWQVSRAQASLNTARARLEQARQLTNAEDLASAQAALDSSLANYEKTKAGAAAEDLASARAALDSARKNYDKVKAGPTAEDLASARAALEDARAAVRQAQAAYDRVSWRPDVQLLQESLNLENATNQVEQAQANYDALANHPTASELASARAQVSQAEAQLAQLRDKSGPRELAAAQAQVSQAEAQLANLQTGSTPQELAVYQAQVDEAQIALEQAQAQLEDARITAPFAGTILDVQVGEGEWATPGAPAVVLAATDPLLVAVNVDEVDVPNLAEGQTAHLSFTALRGQDIVGTVSLIAPGSSNVGGAVAYGVDIRFDPGDVPVRLGMTTDVDVVVASASDTLLVPNRAIEADREAGRYYVTRLREGGTTERIEVRAGLRDASQTQILEGVNEGDRLVLPEVPQQPDSSSQRRSGFFGGPPRQGGGQ